MEYSEIEYLAEKIAAKAIMVQKEVLTSEEAARYLGVSKSCLYKWTMDRQIPHYKSPTGKLCFFNRKEIEAWAQSVKIESNLVVPTDIEQKRILMESIYK